LNIEHINARFQVLSYHNKMLFIGRVYMCLHLRTSFVTPCYMEYFGCL